MPARGQVAPSERKRRDLRADRGVTLARVRHLPLLLIVALSACNAQEPEREAATPDVPLATFADDGAPFLKRHCTGCHGTQDPESGLSLSTYADPGGEAAIVRDFRTFDEVAEFVRDGTMPPETEARPNAAEKARFLEWLSATLACADRLAPPDPGRVTMRRLNRTEYRNTVRDLLGVDYAGVADFPADDVGYGFDNIGDVLTMPPLLIERYLTAAEEIAEIALRYEDPDNPPTHFFSGAQMQTTARGGVIGSGRACATNGEVWTTVRVPRAGQYILRVVAWAQQAGPDLARLQLRAEGRVVGVHEINATQGELDTVEARVALTAGAVRIGAAFVNDYYAPKSPDPKQRDRNLIIESVTLIGPIDARTGPPPETRRRLLAAGEGIEDANARRIAILRALCDRAFRRPATDAEVDRLAELWKAEEGAEGSSFERGMLVSLQAVLMSPHFLFRVEAHPHPEDPAWVRDLDEFALASRLSYFLWSSMPDERLFMLARSGRLHAELRAEAERMLGDPRSCALIRDFGSQWLETRRLATVQPDPERFPTWSADLAQSMQRETELFLAAVVREERSALEIVSASWTFVDGRLAAHYGISGVTGDDFVRTTYPDGRRGGVLGHASVLTVSSYPTRTSPVKRGKWLLTQIVGAPTPPPPPGVGELQENGKDGANLTMREQLARHRKDPTCAVCHVRMDPLGFALENFDAVGRWRDRDGETGEIIDPSGSLPDGRALSGPEDLREALLADDAFIDNLTHQLLTYALGRGPLPSDADVVSTIVEHARPRGHRLSDLVLGVATSVPFRRHRGERTEVVSTSVDAETHAVESAEDPAEGSQE